MSSPDPNDKTAFEAVTATGGTFHSDGRVLVLRLAGSARPSSRATAR